MMWNRFLDWLIGPRTRFRLMCTTRPTFAIYHYNITARTRYKAVRILTKIARKELKLTNFVIEDSTFPL